MKFNNNIILTIAIPTYNRANYLKENLDVLLPQCNKFKDSVEVIISDNASKDETEAVVRGFIENSMYPVKYNRNIENKGIPANIEIVTGSSQGKYIFLMGDDDIMSYNFLDIIMPFLQSDVEYGIIHWGRLVGDENCNNNNIHNKQFRGLVNISSASDFLRSTVSATNFLSSCLFSKKCWELGNKYSESKFEGYGQFARMILGAIDSELPCVEYYMPLVLMRNPSRTWSAKAQYYFLFENFMIFQRVDTKINGMYDIWLERAHDKNFYDIISIILNSHYNVELVLQVKDEILKFLDSRERLCFRIALMKPFGNGFVDKLYWHIVSRILNRLCNGYK